MGYFIPKTFVISALLLVSFMTLVLAHDDQDIVTESAAPLPSHNHGAVVPPTLAPTHRHHHSQSPMAEPPSHRHHHQQHHPKSHNNSHPAPPTHPPVHPPAHSPVQPPVKPPAHAPLIPPVHPLPKRNFVAVQGVVYCKSCKFRGIPTLLGASPLPGAIVKLQCNNTKYGVVTRAVTDKNGYFLIKAPKTITTYGAHKCKASLSDSPLKTCNQPTNLHGGLSGSMLWLEKRVAADAQFALYTVGPFAFEPSKIVNCTI